ncbi:MAG: cupin domain-containing protein, partial [Candidatus Solibacter usitatus]|nr:cupin domain-containing protein [Candidatus Solibacter usitatus]
LLLPALLAPLLLAQAPPARVFWFPKPVRPTPYHPPMKPLTRLADLKAKHYGRTNWSELVIADANSRAWVISAAPGSKVIRHLHPDAPEWWVVQEGRIRFEIEGPEGRFQTIEARKGSYVYAPERHLHALEVLGTEPAIRFEVTLADATSIFETPPAGAGKDEIEYIPVRLQTGPNPTDVPSPGGKPDRIHVNIEDLEAAHRGQSAWTEPAQRKNRVRGNFIYGHAKDNPPRKPSDRGHFHADFAEFWIVLRGRLQWIMEGIAQPLLAAEGDIVYAPPKTFHIPEFYGEGPACRLTSSTYPSANHLYDAR